jgi:alpha-1,2-mannosyltransferase
MIQTAVSLTRPEDHRMGDLGVYVGSVQMLHSGQGLYDFRSVQGAPFTYPPFAGLLFGPLAWVDVWTVRIAWTTMTFAALALITVTVARLVGRERTVTQPRVLAAGIALAVAVSMPAMSNLRFGQVSVFLVLLVLLDHVDGVPAPLRGLATGVASAVKLTPLVFLPHLWFSDRRQAAARAAVSFAACTALAWLALPGESVRYWFTEITHTERIGDLSQAGNQSINGLLLRAQVDGLARTAILAAAGGVVVILGYWRAARATRNGYPLTGVVVAGAVGVAVSPVSWTHHQLWLLFAGLAAVSVRSGWNLLWTVTVGIVMIVPTGGLGRILPVPLAFMADNARTFLAVGIATAVPFVAVRGNPVPAAWRAAIVPRIGNASERTGDDEFAVAAGLQVEPVDAARRPQVPFAE